VFCSNVAQGAALALERRPDVVIFDGSGAAVPPVACDHRILVVGRGHSGDDYLNTYRRLISDVVVEHFELRLRAIAPLEGRVAVFTAGAREVSHLEAEVVHVSTNLADRDALRRDLVDADTYLVELKAAAIDVVVEHALAHGVRVVLAENEVVSPGLDERLLALVPAGARR
jgi:cyclic 2,3-diphosphoglycerate synthetase